MNTLSNPFIDILPPLYDEEQFAEKTRVCPKFDLEGRTIEKLVSLDDLYDYFEPSSVNYDFYARAAPLIYGGYKRRTPSNLIELLNKAKNFKLEDITQKIHEKALTLNGALSFTFLGFPGMGKSLACLTFQRLFPVKHLHKNFGLTQVPVIKIECPSKASTLQLCKNFFQKLDSMIGTNYAHIYRREVELELMRQMANKSVIHFIGVIIIDEIHNLKVGTEKQIDETLNFLKFLNNDLKVPVIYVGSLKAEEILGSTMQNASRMQGSGGIKWLRVEKDSDEWDYMVSSLWDLQVIKRGELTQEIKDQYYKHTAGIYRLLTTLHAAVQRTALINDLDVVTSRVINEAAKTDMFATEVMVLALNNEDSDILDLFDDLRVSKSEILTKAVKKGLKNDVDTASNDLLLAAKKLYSTISNDAINECIKETCSKYPKLPPGDQFLKLKELLNQIPKEAKPKPAEKKPATGRLLELTRNATDSLEAYSLLKEAGIIRPVLDIVRL